MRVAALYDVHGNLPALEAVLAEIAGLGVDRVVVGGDVVPGPMPRQSLAALTDLELPVDFIHGNGETDLLALRRGAEPRAPEPVHEALRWAGDAMTSEQLRAIESWPRTTALEIGGIGEVLFCHATPRDDNEIFTRVTPAERLAPSLDDTGADLIVCGHTHMQFDRHVGDARVINAGSVGLPFGEPGAYWLLLEPGAATLRRTQYDLQDATRRILASSYPQADSFEIGNPRSEAEMMELFEAAALS